MNLNTNETQKKESKVIDIPRTGKNDVLHCPVDYDTTNPEDKLRQFVVDASLMVKRYEQNYARLKEIDTALCDLEHFIEIAPYQNCGHGYRLYRKIAELRRERRACKSENDLLRPVYDYLHATTVLTKLTAVANEVSRTKAEIDGRCYTVRTNILNEWITKREEAPAGMSTSTYMSTDSYKPITYKEYGTELML